MRVIALLLTLWASAVSAQSYPDYSSTTVNDFADLLGTADETTLSTQLDALRQETGVEMTVLTLATQDRYAPGRSLESFATGLFNHWGIGDATRNDGVLVLILRDDRAMRVELGRAYGRNWDGVAQEIVDSRFLPAFTQGDYPRGIMDGSAAIIDRIVRPHLAGQAAPETGSGGLPVFDLVVGLVVIGAVLLALRRFFADALVRFRACPQCGRKGGLRQTREVVVPATRSMQGSGRLHLHCSLCGFAETSSYTIARLAEPSSNNGFGGGSSGGGGASGRW